MKSYQKVLVWFAILGLRAYLGWGIYRLVSLFHRWSYDAAWKGQELSRFKSLDEVVARMQAFDWKRDGMTELFDAVCTPEKVEAVGFNGSSPHGNDCDEEAIWLTNVIEKSIWPIFLKDGVMSASFLTVTWFEPETNTFTGHNVCLLEYADGYRYMDYGAPSELVGSIDMIAGMVIASYAGWSTVGHGKAKASPLVWCRCDKDLRPLASGHGKGFVVE